MNPITEDRQLGEYRLLSLFGQSDFHLTWLAEQISIGRRVLVDELRPEMQEHRTEFLADVRAKAAIDLPMIASVYEAVANDESCFYAHEYLAAPSLADRLHPPAPVSPLRFAGVLRRVAETQLHLESASQRTLRLAPEHIHLDEHNVVRIDNLALAGERAPDESATDILTLGTSLPALVADGQPGASRMLTVLAWMRGSGVQSPLTWEQIRDLCAQIEQQLTGATPSVPFPPETTPVLSKRPAWAIWAASAAGLALLAVVSTFLITRPPKPPPIPPRAVLPQPIEIPAGTYPSHDGLPHQLKAFRIAAHETTIGQYAEFLDTLATLEKSGQQKIFDAKNQPASKAGHQPEHWEEMLAAAKSRSTWLSLPVSLDSPISGIDWWDAAAYAEWKKGRLPTQQEWIAAVRHHLADPTTLKPAPWLQDVTQTSDRTPKGLFAMAGSVSEWSAESSPDPTNPLGAHKWPILGGSYAKPGSNALSREWSESRSTRRPDIGFRIAFDSP